MKTKQVTYQAKARQSTHRELGGNTYKTYEGYANIGEWSDIENDYMYFNHYAMIERPTKKDAIADAEAIIAHEYGVRV